MLLETKRVACALINEVYDLRLAVRTTKMLQVRNHFIIVMIRWTGLAPWETARHLHLAVRTTKMFQVLLYYSQA